MRKRKESKKKKRKEMINVLKRETIAEKTNQKNLRKRMKADL